MYKKKKEKLFFLFTYSKLCVILETKSYRLFPVMADAAVRRWLQPSGD